MDGRLHTTLRGDGIVAEFIEILNGYVASRYSRGKEGALTPVNEKGIREKVRDAYSAAARDPLAMHPFPVGRSFAESLGYPPELLVPLPAESVEAFSGVSNVSLFAEIPRGSVVLDLRCGAGLDSVVAAGRTGPAGRVIGIEFSEEMSGRARRSAAAAGFRNCLVCEADAERLPIRDNTVDVALANGIFNLNPARKAILQELARVLRPGAAVFGAELILSQPLPAEQVMTAADWFA
ncbi:MAG TPA: methyltransferase domain-containing protein [Bryobacteraceae bacterium]|nr:methyltransferase domain-containing protein [Bryobacteraceae bacterium]